MSKKLGSVVLGGGRGFIGDAIKCVLQENGYDVVVVSRGSQKPFKNNLTWADITRVGLPKCVAVINVAGNKFLDPMKRWTPEFQETVRLSRILTTRTLARAIENTDDRPKVFATISGVGYYKPSETVVHDESSPGGDFDFFSRLVADWESAATLSNKAATSVKQVIIRSGVVLGREGGLVSQLIWPFFFGLGGPIGNGRQYMPWIHVDDLARLFAHVIHQPSPVDGLSNRLILNGVAPQLITNAQFSKAFARALWRPALLPVPAFVFVMAFGKDRAKIMMDSVKVVPKRALEIGFEFDYPDIDSACKEFSKLIYADEQILRQQNN